MPSRTSWLFCSALALSGLTMAVHSSIALTADLPKSTQEMLKKLKVDARVLKNLDEALNVPKSMLDAAIKGGPVRVGDTNRPKQFRDMARPFHERYPDVQISYARANRYDRVIKPLIAFKSGKVVTDVIVGLGGNAHQFQKLNALAKIDDLPAYKQLPDVMKSPNGDYAGHGVLTRCFAYNSNKVKKAELPKTWEDVITSKRWAGKNLALLNRPDYWALPLWAAKGEQYVLRSQAAASQRGEHGRHAAAGRRGIRCPDRGHRAQHLGTDQEGLSGLYALPGSGHPDVDLFRRHHEGRERGGRQAVSQLVSEPRGAAREIP
jgi:hypothetical protein